MIVSFTFTITKFVLFLFLKLQIFRPFTYHQKYLPIDEIETPSRVIKALYTLSKIIWIAIKFAIWIKKFYPV